MKQLALYKIYNGKTIFKEKTDAPFVEGEYLTIANGIEILPSDEQIEMLTETQNLVLENEAWVVEEKVVNGIVFRKADGKAFDCIRMIDDNDYTSIPPLKHFEGSTQVFDSETKTWSYSKKGQEQLEYELKEAKAQKKNEFYDFANALGFKQVEITLNGLPDGKTFTIVENVKEVQSVLSKKALNGETFEYELKSQKFTIINIPKSFTENLSKIEAYHTQCGTYETFYIGYKQDGINMHAIGLIDDCKTIEELNNLTFSKNCLVGGKDFEVKKLQLELTMQGNMQIVPSATLKSNS